MRLNRTLLVSSSAAGARTVRELLPARDYAPVIVAASGTEARRLCAGSEFDLVIINTPLSDEFGQELASGISADSAAGVLLLVRGEQADEIAAQVEPAGVFVIPKPVSRPFFFQAIRLAAVSGRRMARLLEQNRRLQAALEESRLVSRAKCALIQCRLMTEPQAHRLIEKRAMDRRIPKRQAAEEILQELEM